MMKLISFLTALIALATPALGQHDQAQEQVRVFKTNRTFWSQFESAKEIVRIHDPSILPEIEPYLKDEDRHLRGNAGFIFASLGEDRGFDVICDILKDYSSRPPGQMASACNGQTGCVQAQIRSDRYYAAHLLGDLKQARAVPILVPLLKDPDVQHIVPWSLAQIGDHDAVAPLIETLKDPNPDMRWLAIDALANLKAKEALPHIHALLTDDTRIHFDSFSTVASKAAQAMEKISGDRAVK